MLSVQFAQSIKERVKALEGSKSEYRLIIIQCFLLNENFSTVITLRF